MCAHSSFSIKISCGSFVRFWPLQANVWLVDSRILTAVAFNPFLCTFFGLLQTALENTFVLLLQAEWDYPSACCLCLAGPTLQSWSTHAACCCFHLVSSFRWRLFDGPKHPHTDLTHNDDLGTCAQNDLSREVTACRVSPTLSLTNGFWADFHTCRCLIMNFTFGL